MQNQTEEEWLSGTKPDQTGTGIFILIKTVDFTSANIGKVSDVKSEVYGAIYKMFAKNITYLQCVKMALDVDNIPAFKWVPEKIASYEKLEATKNDDQQTVLCVGHCKDPGNLCLGGECK